MSAIVPNGYDCAATRRVEDDIERLRFAAEVGEVIVSTTAAWSARLGVFGKWGSGKSTVLRFAEQMLLESRNVVFWSNPWAAQNWDHLWEDFGNRLSEALSKAGGTVDSRWLKVAKRSTAWLGSKGVGQIANVGARALRRDKPVQTAVWMGNLWLDYHLC